MRNNRGITIVALIVTIIVMLILLGVSIRFVVDDNGIVGEAEKAKEDVQTKMDEQEKWTQNIIDEF